MSQPFDYEKALKALHLGQSLTGKDGILTPIWPRNWNLTIKMAPVKRPLKPQWGISNWLRRATVMARLLPVSEKAPNAYVIAWQPR